MYIIRLDLNNFRSYQNQSFSLSPSANLILGKNGSGKTNVVEAIYLLSAGVSFRSSSLSKLINWQNHFALVRAQVNRRQSVSDVEVKLIGQSDGHQSISRKFFIDGVTKTRKTYLGFMPSVVFHPEDIRLVAGSPSRRRDFINQVFTSLEWRYVSALSQFNRALKHRNELLDLIREKKASPSETYYWDQSLIKNDLIIHQYRSAFIGHLNRFFSSHPNQEIKRISINYRPSYLTQQSLQANFSVDLLRGFTRSGCHHDDFSFDSADFLSDDKNLAFWGSRGQQRLAVLALRLAQIDFYQLKYSVHPILLLDDIFSELDPQNRLLVTQLCLHYQTIFTSADQESLSILPGVNLISL